MYKKNKYTYNIMILKYFFYLYYKIKGYLYISNKDYCVPFDCQEIEKEESFHEYKNNNKLINKTMFALNNMPNEIYNLLFSQTLNISKNYYNIRLEQNKNIYHNLELLKDDMLNTDIEYIFIRLNIINSEKFINHVNGIIINKNKKYVLIYEPKVELLFERSFLEKNLIDSTTILNEYKFIYAEDIGYNIYTKMQGYDLFCQTYVLFVFILITLNDDINYQNYKQMFDAIITYKNLGYLLYHIDTLLQKNNYIICDQLELWSYPTHRFQNISNMLHFFFHNNEKEENCINENIENINIIEENDMYIVNNHLGEAVNSGTGEVSTLGFSTILVNGFSTDSLNDSGDLTPTVTVSNSPILDSPVLPLDI